MAALPAALQSISLFEYGGELVNANRGLVEYQDLLKRPLESYKYLLTTVERSSVSLQTATLFLDLVFIGPEPETIAKMGSKINARQLMREAGIPTRSN